MDADPLTKAEAGDAVAWGEIDSVLLAAAKSGNADAQFLLASAFEKGEGVKRNDEEAAKWYKKSAKQGVAEAQVNLGFMYAMGEGVGLDYGEAVKWWLMAANKGNSRAQGGLGGMYASGRGVAKDYVLAHMWFSLASERGNVLARRSIDILSNEMTKEQIAEAQKKATAWQAAHQGGE